jgi:hypothetical protein
VCENGQYPGPTERAIADESLWANRSYECAVFSEHSSPGLLDIAAADQIEYAIDRCFPHGPKLMVPWLAVVVEHEFAAQPIGSLCVIKPADANHFGAGASSQLHGHAADAARRSHDYQAKPGPQIECTDCRERDKARDTAGSSHAE